MFKIIILMVTLSCYDKGIKGLTSIFKSVNIPMVNEITYKVERTVKLNNLEIFRNKFIFEKNLKKEELIAKNLSGEIVAELKDKKVIFCNKQSISLENRLIELIYHIFLYSSLDLNRILDILQVKKFKENVLSNDLLKVTFEDGYLIYNKYNKTITKFVNEMVENNIKIKNKVYFDYRISNNVLLLNHFRLESKSGKDTLVLEEILEK